MPHRSGPGQPGQDAEAAQAATPAQEWRGVPLAEAGGRVAVGGGVNTELAVRCVPSRQAPPLAGGPRLSGRDAVLPVARYARALAQGLADGGAPAERLAVDAMARRGGRPGQPAALVALAVRVTGSRVPPDRLRATAERMAAEWVAGGALPPGMDARVVRCTVRAAGAGGLPTATAAAAPAPRAPRPTAVTRPVSRGRGRLLAAVALAAGVALTLAVVRPLAQAVVTDPSQRAAEASATRANPPPTAVTAPRSSAAVAARADAPVPAASVVVAAPSVVAIASVSAVAVAAATTTEAPARVSTGDPVQTVRSFYLVLGQQDYDSLPGLLSGRLRDTVPWQPAVLRQRTPPGELTIEQADLVSQDADGRTATVAVRVRELVWPGSARSRTYVGTWQLVRGPSGWLMDGSDLQILDDALGSGG